MAREKKASLGNTAEDAKQLAEAARKSADENCTKLRDEVQFQRKNLKEVIGGRVDSYVKYLADTYGKDLKLPVDEFIKKHENYDADVPMDVTMQAMDNVQYLLNSSHHDEEIKKAAALLLKRMRK